MTLRLPKYDHFGSADLNEVMAALEARYKAMGNASEIVSRGTLTSPQSSITLSLNGVSYAHLHLTALLSADEVSASPVLIALRGSDTGVAHYRNAVMTVAGGALSGANSVSERDTRLYAGDSVDGSMGQIDLWITCLEMGYYAVGSGTVRHSGGSLYAYRYLSALRHRSFPALELGQRDGNESARFKTGSWWVLSGVRV